MSTYCDRLGVGRAAILVRPTPLALAIIRNLFERLFDFGMDGNRRAVGRISTHQQKIGFFGSWTTAHIIQEGHWLGSMGQRRYTGMVQG